MTASPSLVLPLAMERWKTRRQQDRRRLEFLFLVAVPVIGGGASEAMILYEMVASQFSHRQIGHTPLSRYVTPSEQACVAAQPDSNLGLVIRSDAYGGIRDVIV